MRYPIAEINIEALQKFQQRLNLEPALESVELTPDKKASTVVISHIEMTLDEMFFGQWKTEGFRWQTIANEVQGTLELIVVHPVTGYEIRRTGAASVVIMVDRVPESIKDDPQLRNQWALSPSNKKPNALDMAFPKLKSECLKNAAQSLGKVFGRDLNRKNKDTYKPYKITRKDVPIAKLPEHTMTLIEQSIQKGEDEFEIRQAMEELAELITPEQKAHIENLLTQKSHE
jgi:hypothetical protein